MKIEIEQDRAVVETAVKIICREKNKEIQFLYEYIRQYAKTVWVTKDGREHKLGTNEIYYVEAVDGKTFYYTVSEVLESRESLSVVEDNLRNCSFVRVSKNCLLNISYLKSVMPYENHRLLAIMQNGEKLMVGRVYISALKKAIKEGRGL